MSARGLGRRVAATVALWLGVLAASGHVGSPDVFYAGHAGPYTVQVTVRTPPVVPGKAEVIVRVDRADARLVTVRPAYWRTGIRGAPRADTLARVPGAGAVFDGSVWLMARGAWTLTVAVAGAAGAGAVAVPVDALPRARLAIPAATGWALAVLGALLALGMMSLVRAAVGESVVPEGEAPAAERVRRGRIAFALAAPVLALVLLGGARWWGAEDRAFTRRGLHQLVVGAAVHDGASGARTLTIALVDTLWPDAWAQLVPDHGKLMHLFVIGDGGGFAHLHPVQRDSLHFDTPLPPLPAGRYRVYADVVHQSGFAPTMIASVTVPPPRAGPPAPGDPDDGWGADVRPAARDVATLDDGSTVRRLTSTDAPLRPGEDAGLAFAVRAPDGRPVPLDPYLGMSGHAVVMREDGSVYLHLHPSGSASTGAEAVFAARERGDTTATGRPRLDGAMTMDGGAPDGEVRFPYAFPAAGRYRVWVQVRTNGRVRTARFDQEVTAAR